VQRERTITIQRGVKGFGGGGNRALTVFDAPEACVDEVDATGRTLDGPSRQTDTMIHGEPSGHVLKPLPGRVGERIHSHDELTLRVLSVQQDFADFATRIDFYPNALVLRHGKRRTEIAARLRFRRGSAL